MVHRRTLSRWKSAIKYLRIIIVAILSYGEYLEYACWTAASVIADLSVIEYWGIKILSQIVSNWSGAIHSGLRITCVRKGIESAAPCKTVWRGTQNTWVRQGQSRIISGKADEIRLRRVYESVNSFPTLGYRSSGNAARRISLISSSQNTAVATSSICINYPEGSSLPEDAEHVMFFFPRYHEGKRESEPNVGKDHEPGEYGCGGEVAYAK